jgi:hypothetical protein
MSLSPPSAQAAIGRIWLDRNLGAKQRQEVDSGTNSAVYGDIYQWGRRTDGHDSRGVAEPFTDIVTVRPPVVRLLPLASLACIVIVEDDWRSNSNDVCERFCNTIISER